MSLDVIEKAISLVVSVLCSIKNKVQMTTHGSGDKLKSDEDVLNKYRFLKIEQRFMMSKLGELQLDLHEQKIVIEALKDVDSSRKCFRLVNGILCELLVKDVYPLIETSKCQLHDVCEELTKQVDEKENEIADFKRKFKIKLEDDMLDEEMENKSKKSIGSVLVAN